MDALAAPAANAREIDVVAPESSALGAGLPVVPGPHALEAEAAVPETDVPGAGTAAPGTSAFEARTAAAPATHALEGELVAPGVDAVGIGLTVVPEPGPEKGVAGAQLRELPFRLSPPWRSSRPPAAGCSCGFLPVTPLD